MNLTLYSFAKRQNSTAIPADGSGIVVDVTLKNGVSLNNPVFLLSGSVFAFTDTMTSAYNYAAFEGAYYFIDDVRSVRNDLYELYCTLDVLSTYRAEIFNTSAYVIYRTGGSRNISDRRIAPLISAVNRSSARDIGINRTGHYNLAVTGVAGVTIWQVTEGMLASVLQNIQQWVDNLIPVQDDIVATLGNGLRQLVSQGSAMDCIRSCKWLPFANSSGTGGTIWCGNYNTNVPAVRVVDPLTIKTVDFEIGFTNTGFLRLPPFCDVVLYLPFVGVVNISHPRFADSASVHINISIDNRNGDIAYEVLIGGVPIGCYGASTAVDIPIGISNVSPLKMVQSATSAAAAAAGAGVAAGALSAIGAADCLTATPSTVGGIQGGAGAGLPLEIYYNLIEHGASGAIANMDAIKGTPFFNTARLGDISGYVQTQDASVSGSIRGVLRERVNALLDSGVFLE